MKIISTLIEAHIFRKRKNRIEFLLLKRAEREKYPGIWQMVTGSINKGEPAHKTALREIEEETGLIPSKLWTVPHINSFYSHEKDYVCLVPVFAAYVEESQVKISDEHDDFIWAGKERAKKMLAWPGQRMSVDIIHEYLSKKKSCINFIEIKI